jgi:beta-aspartyl-peptidase (threonine type)
MNFLIKIVVCFVAGCCLLERNNSMGDESEFTTKEGKFAIAIHGGAGRSPSEFDEASNEKRRASLKVALDRGVAILKGGGTSLEAVEAVIRSLEDDPQFNAGKGAVFNAEGSHELDASIMDGKTLQCGAVAGVSHVKNPISLARLVMTETRHVLLAGPGAESFAKEQGVDWVEPSYFDTPHEKQAWERYQKRLNRKAGENRSQQKREGAIGTVGCVALDQYGNLAAGTSTGGMTNKKYGRVGDSPIVGAGTYADNQTCAVSGYRFRRAVHPPRHRL